MEWWVAGVVIIGLSLAFMGFSMPVAFAFFAVSALGVLHFMGAEAGLSLMALNVTVSITSFSLVAIPMFMLMGELFFHSGIARRVLTAFDALMGRVPGRLSYVTVASGTVMAALSGSTMGNTALLGSLMVPEMLRLGYKKYMAMGAILGTGGLAMIIPPSGPVVLLGSIAKVDIGQLLIAGVGPGLMLALLYAGTIFLQVKIDPKCAPPYEARRWEGRERLRLVVSELLPMGFIIFMVTGVMLIGVATPTEAAAFGVLGVLVLAAVYRVLDWPVIRKSLIGTVRVTGMIFLIIASSTTFSQLLAYSGATGGVLDWVRELKIEPLVVLVIMWMILLVLGCLMDQISIMMITVPIFFPLAVAVGYDPIWFGVLFNIAMEISMLTPPFGFSLFVMMGVAPRGTTLWEVANAGMPYVACGVLVCAIITMVPEVALWLPGLMH
jgi:tripartite ATP-independent transporter DctM subunit